MQSGYDLKVAEFYIVTRLLTHRKRLGFELKAISARKATFFSYKAAAIGELKAKGG